MSKSTRSTVHAVIKAAFDYDEGIKELRVTYKRKSQETIHYALLADVASYPKYAVPLVEGQKKAKGKLVMDSAHPKYKAAKKALQRIVADVMGKTATKSEEVEIPAELIAAAEKLAKLAKKHKGARSLASKALAHAFAK